jgi:hypothetical protein
MAGHRTTIESGGRTYVSSGEWAKRCGITGGNARRRILKAGITVYEFPGERWTFVDLDEANQKWKLVDRDKVPDWNRKQQEDRIKRQQLRKEIMERTSPRGAGGRPSAEKMEEERQAALRRLMIGNSAPEPAKTAQKGSKSSESLDLGEFEARPTPKLAKNSKNKVPEQEFDPDNGDGAENDRNNRNNLNNFNNLNFDGVGVSVDDVDNLNVDAYVTKLIVDGMSAKMASEYAGRLLKMKIDLHEFRKLRQSLVPLAVVRDFESQVLTDLRGSLLPIGGELRDDLAACDDPVRCQEMVDERIYGALRMVAQFKTGDQAQAAQFQAQESSIQ